MEEPVRTAHVSRQYSPFVELDRATWANLAATMPPPLTDTEIEALRGLGDVLDPGEVAEVYIPLSRLLSFYASGAQRLHQATGDFLGERTAATPFIIGIAGSVAVGKSTIARLLKVLLSRWVDRPQVELVPTDGFLLPNAELERRGLMNRKGYPESYDRRALIRFVSEVRSGVAEARAPLYSHLSYDIVPDAEVVVHNPDVLIVEGLNVLQPPTTGHGLVVSDLFDFTIYVDAQTSDIARWYEERFLKLQRGAFTDPQSYFHRFANLSEAEARARAREIWKTINEPNLRTNLRPTRSRATLVLRKGADHTVRSVLLRTT